MVKTGLWAAIFVSVLTIDSAWSQVLDAQPPKSWVKRYTRPITDTDAVCHPYENGFRWDQDNGIGVVFQGHLGTTYDNRDDWPYFGEIYNTNQTWVYDHQSASFTKTHPYLRPQKTCGAKIYYDEVTRRTVVYGGGFHGSDNGFYEVDPLGNFVVKEDAETRGIKHSRLPWMFDGAARQWYPLRPLLGGPPAVHDWWGYQPNWAYIKEYGLGMLVPADAGRIYTFSPYLNAWAFLTTTNPGTAPTNTTSGFCPTDYDLYERKAVIQSGTTTYLFDFHTRTWERLTLSPAPTTSYSGGYDQWYEGYASGAYDLNSRRFIFLKDNGSETWSFDAKARQWTLETTTGKPPNSGNMGEGVTYDRKENAIVLFSNMYDEVWTYRQAAADAARLDEAKNLRAVTTAGSVGLTWSAPTVGAAPDRYLIYRAAWTRFPKDSVGFSPGAYQLIDSTSVTNYTDAPPKPANTFYSYSILAAKAGQTGIMSTPAYSCRPAPLGLVATVFSRTRVGLKWVADTASDAAGYNVYRKVGAIPKYSQLVKLNASPVGPKPVFVDSTVNMLDSQIVNYVVTTVNLMGHESGLSPRADTRIDGVPGLWYDTTTSVLNWSPTLSDSIQSYEVWVQPIGTWENGVSPFVRAFANVQDTFKLVSKTFHYKVRAVNKIGQLGHFSDLVPVASIKGPNGMLNGDGMLVPTVRDPFWNKLGLSPAEVKVEKRPAKTRGSLLRIAPNPGKSRSFIYIRNDAGARRLSVYNLKGQLVTSSALSDTKAPEHRVVFDGRGTPSGTYLVRVSGKGVNATQKMVWVR